MVEEDRRKWLPNEAYRLLVLRALADRRASPATKRELAQEVRANHYMISRVLEDLHKAGQIDVEVHPAGFHIRVTEEGRVFLEAHWASMVQLFEPTLRRHFAYGRPPKWVPFH